MLKSAIVVLLLVASDAAAQSRDCTIDRDTYGVPHIFGRSDASVVFGYGYAQAEDNFGQTRSATGGRCTTPTPRA